MSCMNVNGVMFFSLKDEMCLNDVQVVIDEVMVVIDVIPFCLEDEICLE